VQPIPANAPQPWLPLHDFKLRYAGTPTSAVAGQAVRVSVEASADGASAAQLPAIELPAAPGVQVFAEPAQLEERFDAGRPQTVVRRTFSLLAAQAGALHVPGPRVQWWDAVQGVARTTALPALQLQVAAGMAAGMAGPADSHDANAHVDASAPASHAPAAASAPSAPPLPAQWRSGWVWSLLLLALAISMVLAWRWQRGRRGFHLRKPSPPSPQALQQTLQLALQQGDFAGITQTLCALAGDAHGPLDAVLARLEAGPQREAVQQLQAARWGGGNAQTALAALRSAFNTGPRWCKPKQPEASLLPPLYPK
jgi:hypothetical protein